MISAIILAAGESRRMGFLKPLIKINGKTFLQIIVQKIQLAGISDIHVVVGFRADEIREKAGIDVHYVNNDSYSLGQFSSLQKGISNLSLLSEAALVCLGDQPHLQLTWIKQMMDTFYASKPAIIVPTFKGKRGHPVLYAASLFSTILDMRPNQTGRDVQAQFKKDIKEVELPTNGILYDADTPRDLQYIKNKFLG